MSDKKDLLIEIGTEDLPAQLLQKLSNDFGEQICQQLEVENLSFHNHDLFCTPRRLAIVVNGLDVKQKDQVFERKGPKAAAAFDEDGKPTQAALGFARSCNIDPEQLELDNEPDNPRLFYRENRIGEYTHERLSDILHTTIKKLSIPKRMRWNASNAEFIRPIRWLLILFGQEVVDVELFDIHASNTTRGHRFHYANEIVVEDASKYANVLEKNGHVLANFTQRRENILQQVSALAAQANAKPWYSSALLDEITGLVEWPCALLGEFDPKFLAVHKELLISTMQDNQKYIPLLDDKDELIAKFIIVSNIESKKPELVIKGNEKVIVPRFEDAMFFWERDKKIKLEDHLHKLDSVVYEKQLGSLKDKTDRIIMLAEHIAAFTKADMQHSKQAAKLSKCDLVTETVAEFPKLQGIIGRNVAHIHQEDAQVCAAIEEQYLPKQAGSELPSTAVGITLALADRIDTLVGIFTIGKKPTGLKDPYGLRRAALAVLRIIIEKKLPIDLLDCLKQAASLYAKELNASAKVNEVMEYINERYRAYFSDQEVPIDVIDSVLANNVNQPNEIASRVNALMSFRKLSNAEALAAANKRIRNILKKIAPENIGEVDKQLFVESSENNLHDALNKLSSDVEKLFNAREYEQALHQLADLRQPVDQFFDNVMVMDNDEVLKNNRVALLAKIDALFMRVADFSRLQL